MTTSGQICKLSYTAYCNTYCNMGQPYCNILQYAFCCIVSPLMDINLSSKITGKFGELHDWGIENTFGVVYLSVEECVISNL